MSQEYKVIKLKSGEELIAEVSDTDSDKVKLTKPMVFKTIIISDPTNGYPKEGIVLKNWLAFGNQTETTIPSDFIATILEPTNDVITYYLSEKDREDGTYTKTPIEDLTKQIQPKLTDDQIKKVEDYENMISDMFETIFGEMEAEENLPAPPKNPKKKRKNNKDHIIHMNMVFSPEALAHMINEGMIDPRDIMDMIKHFNLDKKKSKKNRIRESINDKKFTGNETKREDFGNKWTDWNPDPDSNDYK
jgi:hypothetical protein